MERGRPRPRIGEWALWQTRDPLGEAGGINLYEYALSNPVNFVDPLGLSVADFFAGAVDGYSGGLVSAALSLTGYEGINKCSAAFQAGSWAGFGASFLTPGVATKVPADGHAIDGAYFSRPLSWSVHGKSQR